MSGDCCGVVLLTEVLLQENGIMRNRDGFIIARLVDGVSFNSERIRPNILKAEHVAVIDTYDFGHVFAKLQDHPTKDGRPRCPHCLASGLDAARNQESV